MSRTLVIALGLVLWTSFAIVSFLHSLAGDPVGPIVAIIIVGTGVVLWHGRERTRAIARASVPAQADLEPHAWSTGGGFPPATD